MKKSEIKFAIIGCGRIAQRHAEHISKRGQLVAVCDIVQEKAEQLAAAYGAKAYTNYADMLAHEPSIDVIAVCSPNGLHAQHAIDGLKAGFHVLCEKPMGLSKDGCESVIYTALQHSQQVFCVMQNRYSPPSVWIKEVIENQLLGDIFMVQLNCYWNRDDRYYKKGGWKGTTDLDGGTLFTQFSHFIDIMYWLFGDISNIQGKFADFTHKDSTEFEDSGFVSFDFIKGGMGSINYSTAVWDSNLESSMTIIGSKGSVKIGGQYMNEIEYCHIENYEMPALAPSNPANDYGTYKGSAANHHYIIENVVDSLKGRKKPTTNALEGLKVVEIIERIYSVRNKQQVK